MNKKNLILLVILFLGVVFGLYWLLNQRVENPQTSIAPTITPIARDITAAPFQTDEPEPEEQRAVVREFYNFYDSCMRIPPPSAERRVSQYCQEENPYASTELKNNLTVRGTASLGADPIHCSQNPPQSIVVTSVSEITENEAQVTVVESFGTGEQTLQVVIRKENSTWKVADIECPM